MESRNVQMVQAPSNINQMAKISSKEFAAKYSSKGEIYNFLATDVGVYLPPPDCVTIYFLKDLMSGKKKMLRTTMVRTIHIPQYQGLGVKDILQFLNEQHADVYLYLPEPKIELPKVPKQWLANVCASLLKDQFIVWVKKYVDKRHANVAEKKDIMIQMDPEIAKVFQKSVAVSTNKGVSANLLQAGSKRRRTKKQIEDDKQAQFVQEQQNQARLANYDALQAKVQMMESQKGQGEAAASLVQQFLDAGYIKQEKDGSFVVPGVNKDKKFQPFGNA